MVRCLPLPTAWPSVESCCGSCATLQDIQLDWRSILPRFPCHAQMELTPAAGSCCPSVPWQAVSAGDPWTALPQMQVLQSSLRGTLRKPAPRHRQVPGGFRTMSGAAALGSGRIAAFLAYAGWDAKWNGPNLCMHPHAGAWSGRHTRPGMPPGCRSAGRSGAQVSCPGRQPEHCTPAAAPCCPCPCCGVKPGARAAALHKQ